MSVFTNIVFVVDDATEQLVHLHDVICTQMPDEVCKVAEEYIDEWQTTDWHFKNDSLYGAGGFSFDKYENTIIGSHFMKYYYFTQQTKQGQMLLNAFKFIAKTMQVNRFIICHELFPINGNDLDEIIENTINEFGQPAKNWEELNSSDYYKEKSWMIYDIRN